MHRLMHEGSGLNNELNFTLSRQRWNGQEPVIYNMFIVSGAYVKRGGNNYLVQPEIQFFMKKIVRLFMWFMKKMPVGPKQMK